MEAVFLFRGDVGQEWKILWELWFLRGGCTMEKVEKYAGELVQIFSESTESALIMGVVSVSLLTIVIVVLQAFWVMR